MRSTRVILRTKKTRGEKKPTILEPAGGAGGLKKQSHKKLPWFKATLEVL